MTPDAINRAARQIALPQLGLDGQQRIADATVVVAGDDLTCEVVARALAAAGVGRLRLVRRSGALPAAIGAALAGSNPDVRVETRAWPEGTPAEAGAAWLDAVSGTAAVVRSGFDDDSMLRAAIRLAIPVVVTRGRDDTVDVVSFRRHGPCPHAPLDVPEKLGVPPEDGPGAVVAGNVAAAEALVLIAGATTGAGRARHISVPMAGLGSTSRDHVAAGADDGSTHAFAVSAGETRATDIPWTPECFACGGSGAEMSFS